MTPVARSQPRWLEPLPHLACAITFGWLSGWWIHASIGIALAIAASVQPRRIAADRLAQLALILTAMVGAIVLGPDADAPRVGRLENVWSLLGAVAILVSSHRLLVGKPLGGPRATASITMVCVMACGGYQAKVPWEDMRALAYLTFVLLFGLLQLEVLARLDSTWSPGRRSTARPAIILVSLLAAAPLLVGLPAAYQYALRQMRWHPAEQVGFTNHSRLGSLNVMLQSSEPVLRVSGGPVDHLRGALYTRYNSGHWSWTLRAPTNEPATGSGATIRIETLGEVDANFFVPLHAQGVNVPRGILKADAGGILEPAVGAADEVTFNVGTRDAYDVMPPTPEDLEIPSSLVPQLEALSREWTRGHEGKAAEIAAISERLQTDYTYALQFERDGHIDPVLEFLLEDQNGHCEYFASAMTLLARSRGVPARMVSGFRVTERNPLTGSWIVRQKNAHAWTEVWLNDGWVTVDATAASELLMATETAWGAALWDALEDWISSVWRWLTARSMNELLITGALLAIFWFFLRRRRRRTAATGLRIDDLGFEGPLPMLVELLEALARVGLKRKGTEPLERFAQRLLDSERLGSRAPDVSVALMSYAALRYGRVGSATEVQGKLQAASRAL